LKPPSRETRSEAIGLFERALAIDPQSVAAQSYLAITLTARVLDNLTDSAAADLSRADELARRALAALPRSPLPHYAKGQVLRAQNRYDEAIPEYETALVYDRNWVNAYAHIGQCKLYAGSIAEAIPLHEQAIRLSPRDAEIGVWYHRVGLVHLLQSRADAAIIWLEKARSAIPAHPNGRAYLASAYALKGETERAAAELTEARRVSGDDRYSSIARLKAAGYFGVPKTRACSKPPISPGCVRPGCRRNERHLPARREPSARMCAGLLCARRATLGNDGKPRHCAVPRSHPQGLLRGNSGKLQPRVIVGAIRWRPRTNCRSRRTRRRSGS